MKTFKICSNNDCSPLAPMTGTRVVRKYYTDTSTLRCPDCKREYDTEVRREAFGDGDICACGATMSYKKRWYYECPKCKNKY